MKQKVFLLVLAALIVGQAVAQENSKKGYLTGSFETNTNYYKDDKDTKAQVPDGHFGSNNYVKLDYYQGKFAVGVQLEAYLPALVGYPAELDKAKLTNYYVTWKDDDFSVTAGSFYDQFGSGLLFRSWEDRTLGLNNAIMGARATYNYKDIVAVKAIWGTPRFGMDYTDTRVYGADVSFSLSNLLGWQKHALAIEGSVLNRYEEISIDLEEEGGKPYRTGFSGRLNYEYDGFSVKAEYVDAGDKNFVNPNMGGSEGDYLIKRGNAQLIELGWNKKGLGVNLTGRRLEWMKSEILSGNGSTSNLLNYVPAMCTQYTYMLTTLHPYSSQLGEPGMDFTNSGEIGGQIDVFYNFKRGTALGGKRGTKVHANFSTYYTLAEEKSAKAGNLLYRDFSFDVEKQWTRDFKMNLLYSYQEYNPSYGKETDTHISNIFVADLLYKFTKKISARLELQYLNSLDGEEKDWMAALLEVNFAPAWSIWGSDMYNHGNEVKSKRLHYYNVGVSYVKNRTRVALGYGRYKAGYLCSGGVCRLIPAYTGATLTITTSF